MGTVQRGCLSLAADTHRWAQYRRAQYRSLSLATDTHTSQVVTVQGEPFAGYRHSQVGTVQGCFSLATDTHRWAQYRGAFRWLQTLTGGHSTGEPSMLLKDKFSLRQFIFVTIT